ncbi:GUN4 domain protein [Thalassoporum mexicanum PCC 7367]|uniref:GUN4 domain-containing protein n=1 Tax=Thalassoporum mexicanum TaxID=3457544 RepID=UPI00029F856B|nr:GUN4 domain-containing protein [Pseudanabaena sp. PCC 7367]AFY69943.1 GUN4 domain protein [Pseudanabaena sp. PCC 7367]
MQSEEFLIQTSLNNANDQPEVSSIDAQVLKQNLAHLVSLVEQIGQSAGSNGDLQLDEIAVAVRITAEGQLVLLGDGAASGAMTLKFKRPAPAPTGAIAPVSVPAEPVSTPTATPTKLPSAAGVDYSRLKDLLMDGNWQEANQETWNVMCLALHKNKGSYLSPDDISQLPCQDLQTIDQLWRGYSQGRFGFSVQSSAYKSFQANKG